MIASRRPRVRLIVPVHVRRYHSSHVAVVLRWLRRLRSKRAPLLLLLLWLLRLLWLLLLLFGILQLLSLVQLRLVGLIERHKVQSTSWIGKLVVHANYQYSLVLSIER